MTLRGKNLQKEAGGDRRRRRHELRKRRQEDRKRDSLTWWELAVHCSDGAMRIGLGTADFMLRI